MKIFSLNSSKKSFFSKAHHLSGRTCAPSRSLVMAVAAREAIVLREHLSHERQRASIEVRSSRALSKTVVRFRDKEFPSVKVGNEVERRFLEQLV